MKFEKKGLLLIAFFIMSLVLVACSSPEATVVEVEVTRVVTEITEVEVDGQTVEVEVTRVVTETEIVEVPVADEGDKMMPVTLHINHGTEPPTIDPSLATDSTSVNVVGNLFVGLTKFHPVTGEVEPSLATEWSTNEDGTIYTFKLRDDVAWVKYDPISGETSQVMDADGNPDFVDAYDVEYGVKRTINPETASDYSYVLYILKNAQAVNSGEEEFTLDDVGVRAIDATTVEFELENAAGFFPAVAGMWVAYPLHADTLNEWGNKWTEAGLIVTSGPYVLEQWIHGGELNMAKNPLWINADNVQIERIQGSMIAEASTAFALYENFQLDTAGVPSPELDRVRTDDLLSAQYYSAPVPCTYYYGMTNTKAPFDDRRVRYAFSAAFDRQSLIDNVLKAGQTPASSFAPPGIFGAPEPGTVGVTYDTAAAVASLQEYLDEKGMTVEEFNAMDITLMHNTSEGHARIAAAAQQMWKDALGVEIRVENQEWGVYLDTIQNTTAIEEMPHIWRLGWCADYPDENNWVHEVFNADAGANRLRRTASEFDQLTADAGKAQDPAARAEMYAKAEQILAFDEAAYIPIYHYTSSNVTQPWLTRDYPPLGAQNYYDWTIDWDAKMAAQN